MYSDMFQDVTHTKDIHVSDHPQAQEKPLAMVAENIEYPQKELLPHANEVLQRETATIQNLGITDLKGNLITNEEGPVLVPGLTPLSIIPTEETRQDRDKRSISMEASVRAMEAKDQTFPEVN